ncbi:MULTISPECIES: nuclease A inhibitor family protein [Kamptonema]|uniref:nuclease A inhibitor family protein n=1 Tax=Kamptonema TaxID=1501433 RepID=UPI0001DACB5E|nr:MULTISPECIES: nuclease A inhibitor family protein [Kamptonema]CBN58098.1 hypothetical protein OSCI_3620021 [Kamptonema sp. PCC 6506]
MKLETEQLLGTLEVLCKYINSELFCEIEENTDEYPTRAFFWENEEQAEFNVFNLTIANGLSRLTDVELAIESWQATERRGKAFKNSIYSPDWEESDNILDAETEAERAEKYQSLWQLLNSNLRDIQAFNLSAHHRYLNFCVIIGKTEDGDWICLTPTMANQFNFRDVRAPNYNEAQTLCDRSLGETTLALATQVQRILAQLTPISIHGYDGGGYKYTYEHKIVCAAGTTKALAFEKALQVAKMLIVTTSNLDYYIPNTSEKQRLIDFINLKLRHLKFYTLCFWDMGYIYKIGQAATGEWLGINAISDFEYRG